MAKRFLGLDIGPNRTYLVVLDDDKGRMNRVRFLESRAEGLTAQLTDLRNQLGGDLRFGDRIVAALPAKSAYVRHLEFPFHDTKKIASTLPYELSAQIPVAAESCATASLPAGSAATGAAQVTAAAVPKTVLQDILAPAEAAGIPLHIVDLSPFAYFAGLGDQCSEGVLLFSNDTETTISLIRSGKLVDYRLLPTETDLTDTDKSTFFLRELRALLAKSGQRGTTIYLMGGVATDQMATFLTQQGEAVELLTMRLADEDVPPGFLPAAALALRARVQKDHVSFNFRQGPFALRGEWQKLKKSMMTSACLVILTVAVLAGAAVMNYQDKTGQAKALQQQMNKIYRDTFPGATAIADVPLQMKSALRDLRERSSLIGGAQTGVLAVLKEISDLPDDLQVEYQEFTYGPGETRLTGRANSFEAVNRVAEHLAASPLFSNVQVADAKMALEGNRVNFRLLLTLAGEGEEQ